MNRRTRDRAVILPAALAISWLVGCSMIANLSQFDGATTAGTTSDALAPPPDGEAEGSLDAGAELDTSPTVDAGPAVDAPAEAGTDGSDAGSGNLIQNPGFELGVSPWTSFIDGTMSPSLSVSSARAHSGAFSGWVAGRTKSFQGTVQDIRQAAVQGHTYVVSAWAMIEYPADAGPADAGGVEPVDITATFSCLMDGAATPSYTRIGAATANTSSWTQITGMLTVPVCTMTNLQVYVEGPAPGVDLYVDDVSVSP